MPGYQVSDSQLQGNTAENISKYRCPECKLLLREAVQPSCGHWLCNTCAVEIFKKKKPRCPRDDCGEELVPEDGQDFFPDRFVRREILSFTLSCSNASLGCVWEGTLSKYEDHLEECTFVTCQCGKTMKRTEFNQHKNTACPKSKRPCPLCHLGCSLKNEMTNDELYKHFSETSDIVTHFEILASVVDSMQAKTRSTKSPPLPKRLPAVGADLTVDSGYKSLGSAHPNRVFDEEKDGVGKTDAEQYKLKALAVVPDGSVEGFSPVPFHAVDMPYGRDIAVPKFSDTRWVTYISRAVHEGVEKVRKELMGEIELKDEKIRSLEHQMTQMQKTLQAKNSDIEDRDFRLSLIENSNYDGTMIWKIPQFSQRMTDAKTGKYTSIFSLPFYSSRYGYKMCLRLYIMGDGIGKGTHMSLFFVIMRGEFDNILTWPFTQRVTFRLINQGAGRDIVDTFQPDPMSSSFKKPKSDMNIASGCPRFITHENLKNGYIVEDTIFIKCVVDRSALSHP